MLWLLNMRFTRKTKIKLICCHIWFSSGKTLKKKKFRKENGRSSRTHNSSTCSYVNMLHFHQHPTKLVFNKLSWYSTHIIFVSNIKLSNFPDVQERLKWTKAQFTRLHIESTLMLSCCRSIYRSICVDIELITKNFYTLRALWGHLAFTFLVFGSSR